MESKRVRSIGVVIIQLHWAAEIQSNIRRSWLQQNSIFIPTDLAKHPQCYLAPAPDSHKGEQDAVYSGPRL